MATTVVPTVLIPMADYGHDPTETCVPYTAFKKAGFEVHFATENGKAPQCDLKLLEGLTQKLLGATSSVITSYKFMSSSPEWLTPISWTSPTFSLGGYNLIFLPGGHEKGVRQVIDSPIIAGHLGSFFPTTLKSSQSGKCVSAVCHGVLGLSEAKIADGENKGKSVIHDCDTTALPARFEQVAYWGTRLWLGDYYKTYGKGSEDVEAVVRARLDEPEKQWKGSLGMSPFVVEDKKYNYISARFPADAWLLAEKTVELVKESLGVL